MELLAEQAYLSWLDLLALVIKKLLENLMHKCNQPNESNSCLVAWRYKTHGSNDKSQKFTRRLFPPFTRWCFASYDPRIFVNLKSSKQVKWAVYRQESKAEQKEKFCMGSFFAQFVVWYTRVAYFIFCLENSHQMLRMCKASADIWYEIFQKPTFTANDIAVVYGTLHSRLSATVIVVLRQGNLGFYGSD